MRIMMTVALAWSGAAAAQAGPAAPAREPFESAPTNRGDILADEGLIMVPRLEPIRMRPNPEVMALARRIAELAREPDVTRAYVELFERSRRAQPPRPSTRIVARPLLPMPSQEELQRGLEATERLTERIAEFYAATFTLGELREMAAFFESPTGRRYIDRRRDATAHALAAIAEPSFQALGEPRCAAKGAEGPQDGSKHAYLRLPVEPPAEAPNCRATRVR